MTDQKTGALAVIGIIVIVFLAIAVQKGGLTLPSLQATLSPESYTEWQCEDVTAYKANGYTVTSTDSRGCEIVSKSICNSQGTRCNSYGCACAPVVGQIVRSLPGGTDVTGWYCPYGNTEGYCSSSYTDTKGGAVQIVNTCTYDVNDLLAVESFSGGQKLHRTGSVAGTVTTRYPIKAFCKAHPAIIINKDTQQSVTSTVLYDTLWSGETLDIPASESWTIFYILENNYQLPTICKGSDGLALNTETKTCVASTGIVYVCSQGQFDPALGTCVVQAEKVCDAGRLVRNTLPDGSYNYSCVYSPPLQADCSSYGVDAYYSVNQDKCVYIPEVLYVCDVGDYDSELGLCAVHSINNTCPDGGSYNSDTDYCESPAQTVYKCDNGVLQTNEITGKRECIVDVLQIQKTTYECTGTIDASGNCVMPAPQIQVSPCPSNTTWDASSNTCITPPVISTPAISSFIEKTKPNYISLGLWMLLIVGIILTIVIILTRKK